MNDWELEKLGDLCDFVRGPFGGSLKKSCFVDGGYAVYEQQHAINNQFEEIRYFINRKKFDEMRRFELLPGDLIMSCSGTMGKTAIVPKNIPQGIINQALLKLTMKGKLIVQYLKYWMESPIFQMQLEKYSKGVAIKNVASVKVLKNIEILLPPLPEQKRIVAILDEVFAGISKAVSNTEKNLVNARNLFESILNSSFIQEGESWVEKNLSEILDVQPRNGWSPPAKYHSDMGTPVLTLSSVTGYEFDLSKIKYTLAPTKNDAHYWLNNEDLLISRSNTSELVGHVAICSGIDKPVIYPDLIMRMRVNKKFAYTRFIYYQLRSNKLRRLITESAKGANPTMKKISKGIVQGLPIVLPDLVQQKRIIDKIDAFSTEINHIESIYQKKLTALAELKQSILQKAFAGELTANKVEQLVN